MDRRCARLRGLRRHDRVVDRFVMMKMNPSYPIYVVSKGRWRSRLTVKCLEDIGVPYRIVVEEQECASYAEVIDCRKILVLPQRYIDEYDIVADIGQAGRTGPGATRNFCW